VALSELKDQIKAAAISHIIGSYISLRKNGSSNFLGLCPFHADAKPSLNVNDEKGMFMCFACNTGGDAITFVEKFKHYDFIDALREIAQLIGVNFDDFNDNAVKNPKLAMAKKILDKAMHIYRKMALSGQFPEFKDFTNKRKLSIEALADHHLGFASKQNTIANYLQKAIVNPDEKKLAWQVALEIGLIKTDKNNPEKYYDTFRERIMFPIWDHFGHTVGFTSRAIHEYQKAKYMNSLESYVFNKRNILYGLHLAKPSIRELDSVILVEGNMDQIALSQHGFKNTVAIQGIGLSDFSVQTLKRLSKNFYLCLDADKAGYQAAEKVNLQCLEAGIIAKIISLAPYKDPDDLLVEKGALLFKERFDNAAIFLDDQIERLLPAIVPSSPDEKLALLQQVFAIVAPLKEDLKAIERIGQFAKGLELSSDQSQILNAYKNFLLENKASKHNIVEQPSLKAANRDQINVSVSKNEAKSDDMPSKSTKVLSKLEKIILREIISNPQSLTHDKMPELLDFVTNTEVKRYVSRLINLMFEIEESEFPALAMNELNREGISLETKEIAGAALYNFKPLNMLEKVVNKFINDLLKRIHESDLKDKKIAIKQKKNECKTDKDLEALMLELIKVERKLINLKSNKKTQTP